ncbi:hypothetical protein PINS_up022225 [Pythium insidiosum]|nr:hypothetical protein PINS_up022225 [Pythium insidiosum]
MLQDELLGVCKINLTPHLSLFNGSAEAKANGALPRWHNLCDQYNDCRESWAPPTVFRGRIQVAVIFAPTVNSAEAVNDPKIQGRRLSMSGSGSNPNDSQTLEETLVQSMPADALRELLRIDRYSKQRATGAGTAGRHCRPRGGRVSRVASTSTNVRGTEGALLSDWGSAAGVGGDARLD